MQQQAEKTLRLDELRDEERRLCEAALAQRKMAYAPYSHFSVGAALRSEAGDVFVGCNVENASFGLTVCAERHAVAAAVAAGHRRFVQIAIASESDEPASPCGACRQVLNEFAPELEILLVNTAGEVERRHLDKLLPRSFSGAALRASLAAKETGPLGDK